MADIRCPICGEPWERDTLHDEVAARYIDLPWISDITGEFEQKTYDIFFAKVRQEFSRKGCNALKTVYGGGHNEATINKPRNAIYGELLDLAGDDIDFATSMIEDAERYGLLD